QRDGNADAGRVRDNDADWREHIHRYHDRERGDVASGQRGDDRQSGDRGGRRQQRGGDRSEQRDHGGERDQRDGDADASRGRDDDADGREQLQRRDDDQRRRVAGREQRDGG